MILALAGGVGGAKLAQGLARALASDDLVVIVNTGDDFHHLGLHISPDLDTIMYTLAGTVNADTGWGLAEETWNFMSALEKLGGPTWFRLGDKDIATHVERTRSLAGGMALSQVTRKLCERFGVAHHVSPMSDNSVRTIVHTGGAELEFQHYFVRDKCEPVVESLEYRGAGSASMARALADALASPSLEGVVICPSNPYLSIAPILSIPDVRKGIGKCRNVIAVSPIVGGAALKGPAAKIMRELGEEVCATTVAACYRDILRTLVIDNADIALVPAIQKHGVAAETMDIVMQCDADRVRLAGECIRLLRDA